MTGAIAGVASPTGTPTSNAAWRGSFPAGSAAARDNLIVMDRQRLIAQREAGSATSATNLLSTATPGLPPSVGVDGHLPAGVHDATLGELRTRFATNPYRAGLVDKLESALPLLADGGVSDVVIGGSFLSTKQHPGDLDLVYVDRNDAPALALQRAIDAAKRVSRQVTIYRFDAPSVDKANPTAAVRSTLELFAANRELEPRGMVRIRLGLADAVEAAARLIH